ncbi:MAG TPA: hypothetical protein DCQ47_07155 [Gammaproteobacteria bacterium]|nr:hypothetical protein [Gammaproteobacteria bacterium]
MRESHQYEIRNLSYNEPMKRMPSESLHYSCRNDKNFCEARALKIFNQMNKIGGLQDSFRKRFFEASQK